jgi:hypothetical protein
MRGDGPGARGPPGQARGQPRLSGSGRGVSSLLELLAEGPPLAFAAPPC